LINRSYSAIGDHPFTRIGERVNGTCFFLSTNCRQAYQHAGVITQEMSKREIFGSICLTRKLRLPKNFNAVGSEFMDKLNRS
jgi:hypothetical protein